MNVEGQIVDYDGTRLVIVVPFTDTDFLLNHVVEKTTVMLNDGRTITDRQRRYIYALLRDISFHTGHQSELLKDIFKGETLSRTGGDWFSLSDCSMTQANEMIETLIEFCIEWRVPTQDSLLELAPDIERYIYCCLKNKVCCITQREGAELHHVDHVGMGRDRHEIPHKGLRAMPLLRRYHNEAHIIGQKTFDEKYHVFGVELDDALCKVWNLKKE